MPQKPGSKPPSYRLHKSSGQAITTLVDSVTGRRRDFLLGPHNTPESRARYHQLIGQWESIGLRVQPRESQHHGQAGGVSVRSLTAAYLRHIKPLISPTHYQSIDRVLGLLCDQYGDTSAATLGPRKLKQIRETLIGLGWKRNTINKGVRFIVSAVRWAASEELVPAEIHTALATVPNLKRGEAGVGVGEGERIPPAPATAIKKARKHLPRQVQAMIDLQLLTGMRPGEVVIMRRCDMDTTAEVWTYRPAHHKTQHHGHSREVLLGPKAIAVLRPFMGSLKLDGYLFDPRQANAEQAARDAAKGLRPNQKPNPTKTGRTIGPHYTTASYRRAVQRACDKAGVAVWSPNQLRHNAATTMRASHRLEAAALLLGHSEATVTARHYAEKDKAALAQIVAKIG